MMKRLKVPHSISFWLAVALFIDYFLVNIHISDNSAWIQKITPSLKGAVYPHLGTALMLYGVSILFIIIAFIFFTSFVVRFLRAKQQIPIGLKGYWILSFIAFVSAMIPFLAFKYTFFTDIRISAFLNLLFTSTFLITGIIANFLSDDYER